MNLENKKQIAIILLAIGLGLIAAYFTGEVIKRSVNQQTADLAKEYETKKIAPLIQEVGALRQEVGNLQQKQMAMAQQQPQATPAAPAVSASTLAIKTPAGKRALTVLLDSLSAVGGMINPGDFVDILAHLTLPAPPNSTHPPDKISAILFQNVQILAVGTNVQTPGDYAVQQAAGSLNVTFAVDPEEAGLLIFSQQNGKLQIVLRSPSETQTQVVQPASWETLASYALDKGGIELAVPRARAVIQAVGTGTATEAKPYIQIFRGGREL